ncbi:MAG TPA: TlpA family protein disulfide reductase [Candidatus Alistipes avicola]|uniref:TlpA family protein disulfide reductase n=1 Tax=Candidatus Alistipes avicola TaxID=2838432 RepID=A0A9D2IBF0_9BACT|nr:TlpA disulfide reductase family protein [uncultured Alistipes sp.]HJA98135.1 TlpA family protein disulfide reductase [Candidatus Alistipes avicola]
MTATRKKANNKRLLILVLLLIVVIALMWFLPSPDATQPNNDPTATTEQTAEEETDENTTLVKVGDKAPDFRVEMFDGTTFTLASLEGKVVLLNFWATWCPPCRDELSRVQKDVIDRFVRPDGDFVFLPISRGEARETVAAFREKMGYTFPMGLDPEQQIYKLYASNYIPRNFLIGRDGKVIALTVGYDEEEFNQFLETIAAQLKSDN